MTSSLLFLIQAYIFHSPDLFFPMNKLHYNEEEGKKKNQTKHQLMYRRLLCVDSLSEFTHRLPPRTTPHTKS